MIDMSLELAEICGIHAGDGYLRLRNNSGELDISGHLEEKDYYDNYVLFLFNKTFNLKLKGREFSRGSYGFVVYNKDIAKFFSALGFPYGEKSTIVKVPKEILNSKNKVFYARFLRGLFDTDGNLYFKNRKTHQNYSIFKTKYNYYPMIKIRTVSKILFKEVSFMLKKLDIKHFISSYQPKKKNENKIYTIHIDGVDRLNKWINIIGMKNPVKLTRYLIWKKFGFCPPNTTLRQREDILNDKLDIYSLGS